jgi:hypothetical protein
MTDFLNLIADLPSTKGYSKKDRYRDFRKVFLDTELGPKVLSEILAWARIYQPGIGGTPIDPYLMAIREGQRNIALVLLDTIYNEPPDRPAKQKR